MHAARHTERFFRDSILVPTNQGATYEQKPAFHRVHRNNITRPKEATERFVPTISGSELINDKALYFTDSENYGHMLLNAESASCTNFLTGARSRGFTYAGWVRLAPTDGSACFFTVGKNAASSNYDSEQMMSYYFDYQAKHPEIQMKQVDYRSQGIYNNSKIVITGSFENFSRNEIEIKLRSLGGKIISSISKNTDFLIVGNDPGSKLKKARAINIDIKGIDFINKLMRD